MGLLSNVTKAVKNKLESVKLDNNHLYVYDTPENRVNTVRWLYTYARNQRMPQVEKWLTYNDYYEGRHKTQIELNNICQEKGLPFLPAVMQFPFSIVEGLIIPEIPDFEFNGRDDDLDSQKAKQREYVVRYVVEDNKIENMNTENERQLNKLGNAFWKVAFDYGLKDGDAQGKIIIGNPDPSNIFPDPTAMELEDCEYIDYVYRMHKIKVARKFAADFKRLGITINDLNVDGLYGETEIYDTITYDVSNDTMQVIEHWFRQPEDGEGTFEYYDGEKVVKETVQWEAGDIACCIIISDTEIRYIPKYWVNTGIQNKMYPFIKYCKIPINKSFWDRSELDPILDLVDAADRELSINIMNDMFNGNDIIIEEENAMADDSEQENVPGAKWKVKAGQINNVRRLGGLSNLNGGLKDTITFLSNHIKDTVGLYDINQGGAPPSNVKTLGGLVELKQQGEKRQSLKKADRDSGFELLYELIDWTALEFYDDNRIIFLGAEGDQPQQQVIPGQNMDRKKGAVIFRFNSQQYQQNGYYPRIDAKISVGDGITHNKALTLSATETIAQMNITPENYKIVMEMVDIMQLPNRKEIKEYYEQYFTQLSQPKQQEDKPSISIAYKDAALPPNDAQAQILALAGINVQSQQIPQQGEVPQLDPQHIIDNLSEEEKQKLAELDKNNPQILESILGGQQ